MTPEEAAKNINDAVRALESGSRHESQAAFEFLRKVPDGYHVALDAFRNALRSTSTDARMQAAAALAKLGKGDAWVLPALMEAYLGESKEFVRSRLAFSIASLKTPEAATALVELLEQELKVSDAPFSVSAFCEALSSFGALAIHELPQVNRLMKMCKEQKDRAGATTEGSLAASAFESLRRAKGVLVVQTQSSYYAFVTADERYLTARPLLGRDRIQREPAGRSFGDLTVVFDKRVDFVVGALPRSIEEADNAEHAIQYRSLTPRFEVRCVLFEREPGAFVCIAVWDHFATSSLMNKFEYFASGVVESLLADTNGRVRIEFGLFQPVSERSLDGDYTGVRFSHKDDALEITAWLPDSRFEEIFGEHSRDARELLGELPSVPEGFTKFVKGSAQDAAAEARLAEKRRDSLEGRLDYSALYSSFCDQVQEATRTGKNPITKQPNICGDSFDPVGNEEFFAKALPEPIRELVLECQWIAEEAAANGNRKQIAVEWPDIALIPPEFIVHIPRPFELEVADGVPQVTLALDPATHGVVLFRCIYEGFEVCVTNVPFSVFGHSESFSWGYRGTGTFGLAKNIINAFVPPGSDGQPEVKGQISYWGVRKQTFASHTAENISPEFYERIVAKIPAWGGVISAQRIKAWILSQVVKRG